MILTLIAAIGKNNELGKKGNLVWRLPADQKYFRDRTAGHTMIMGRKTFESLPGALPNRRHIVITRDKNYKAPGVEITHSLEEAINLAKQGLKQEEVFIIGGAEIFKQAMELNCRLDITHIEAEDKDADTFFPEFNKDEWKVISEEFHPKDEKHEYEFTFKKYDKIS